MDYGIPAQPGFRDVQFMSAKEKDLVLRDWDSPEACVATFKSIKCF